MMKSSCKGSLVRIEPEYFQNLLDGIFSLTNELVPILYERKGWDGPKLFDPNSFLDVFDKIRIKDGFVLDYVYDFLNVDAKPGIYTRAKDAPRILLSDGRREFKQDPDIYSKSMNHISFEKSPKGYFQYFLFLQMVGQFYLRWHANYDEVRFVFTKKQLEYINKMIPEIQSLVKSYSEEAGGIDWDEFLSPKVEMSEKKVRVSAVRFTPWGGLFIRSQHIMHPNSRDDPENETIAPHEAKFLF